MKESLNNPAALALLNTEAGQDTVKAAQKGVQMLLAIGGGYLVATYALKQYRRARAKRFARENISSPDVQAATIIYRSFSRFEFPGFLSFVIGEINLSTDEESLFKVANQVSSVKAVAQAYDILFNRDLLSDVNSGLDTKELTAFWARLNQPSKNTETTMYAVGTVLYSALKQGKTQVNKAIQDEKGNWTGTNELYGLFDNKEELGTVIANGIVPKGMMFEGLNYYIIQRKNIFGGCVFNCDPGVVIQTQVINKE